MMQDRKQPRVAAYYIELVYVPEETDMMLVSVSDKDIKIRIVDLSKQARELKDKL